MPRTEEIFESIGSASIITTLDLAKGYWQIPMTPDSKDLLHPLDSMSLKPWPFGLHNAPATFQRTINFVLQDCQGFARAYIDDVVVRSKSWEEHLNHLTEIFSRLETAGLTLKLKKCQFGASEAVYLGHVVGNGNVQPSPVKIEAI